MIKKLFEQLYKNQIIQKNYIELTYIIGKGEIVTVFYRYICLYFFGYLSVNSDEDRDRIYDI